jgi:recombination protein U
MLKFKKQKGIAFFLIYYTHKDLIYYMPIEEMMVFLTRAREGGRKSFRFDELNPSHFLEKHTGVMVPYLDMIAKELEEEENSKNC